MKRILILFAHPAFEKSRVNRRLIQAVRGMEGVTLHDLYQAYPDFHVDVTREQALLLEHDLIVLHHPFFWFSCPALLKEWLDLVLQYGFAYGAEGTALEGKWMLTAITTGGREAAYREDGINRYPIAQFLRPFQQTATLCGMIYLPPFIVHGTHKLTQPAQIEPHAAAYRELLAGLRDGAITAESVSGHTRLNSEPPLESGAP